MRLDVVTIFPEYLTGLRTSLIGKALESGVLSLTVHDLREATDDLRRTVDGTPAGGGAGMVMTPEPWGRTLDRIVDASPLTPSGGSAASDVADPGAEAGAGPSGRPVLLVTTPAGTVFNQALAKRLSAAAHLVFACGRYEGIDDRVIQDAVHRYEVLPVSIGDYVLFGGEVAAMVMIEAITRHVPGVLGNPESLVEESHSNGLLEYPVYSGPQEWRGLTVPDVLRSGDHARIAAWRATQSEQRTALRRPDLLPATVTDQVTVRAATPADLGEICTLTWACHGRAAAEVTSPTATVPGSSVDTTQAPPLAASGTDVDALAALPQLADVTSPDATPHTPSGSRTQPYPTVRLPMPPTIAEISQVTVAQTDVGRIVGWARWTLLGRGEDSGAGPHTVRCEGLIVAPDVERQGVATALLEAGVRRARQAGWKPVVAVPSRRKDLLKALTRRGATKRRPRDGYVTCDLTGTLPVE